MSIIASVEGNLVEGILTHLRKRIRLFRKADKAVNNVATKFSHTYLDKTNSEKCNHFIGLNSCIT